MTNADQTLSTLLSGSTALQPHIHGRVYPDRAPSGAALPFVVFSAAVPDATPTLAGGISNPDIVMDVHVWGTTREQVNTVTEVLVMELQAAGIYMRSLESGFSDEQGLCASLLKVVFD